MIQNINILAGVPPVRTGNDRADLEACIRYLNRLARAQELNFDQLDHEQEQMRKTLIELEIMTGKLRKAVQEIEQAAGNQV